jgi:hypothetical protein
MLVAIRKACFTIGLMTSDEIIARLGGTAAVARLCQCTPQAVSQWFGLNPDTGEQREIPKARLMYLQAVRPDAFEERRKVQRRAADKPGAH